MFWTQQITSVHAGTNIYLYFHVFSFVKWAPNRVITSAWADAHLGDIVTSSQRVTWTQASTRTFCNTKVGHMAMLDAPDANSPMGKSSMSQLRLCPTGHATVSATTRRVSLRETVLHVWRVVLESYIITKGYKIKLHRAVKVQLYIHGTVFPSYHCDKSV